MNDNPNITKEWKWKSSRFEPGQDSINSSATTLHDVELDRTKSESESSNSLLEITAGDEGPSSRIPDPIPNRSRRSRVSFSRPSGAGPVDPRHRRRKSILKKDQTPAGEYVSTPIPKSNAVHETKSLPGLPVVPVPQPRPLTRSGQPGSKGKGGSAGQKEIPLKKYAIPPNNLMAGAPRDDDLAMDWKGNFVDVPLKFYRTTVKREHCPNEDLNEIFAEKFCLNEWNEYFGRTVIATCYLYMLLSIIILVMAIGLYQNPTDAQTIARLDVERNMKGPYAMLACGIVDLVLALTLYIAVLQDYRRILPYILHAMVILSIVFLTIGCWSGKEWASPSDRDYLAFFVASTMYNEDPEFLESVWPSLKPTTWSEIQRIFACCGYKASDDWKKLSKFRSKPALEASCCVNTTGGGVPSKCAYHLSAWLEDPTNSEKLNRLTGTLAKDSCEVMLQRENDFYVWDIKLYPLVFFVAHTGILFIVGYLVFHYIREVNTWDGEVRMRLYREGHKNFLKYLLQRAFNRMRFLCRKFKVYPKATKPQKKLIGGPTHFEVWHTSSGEIINVIELDTKRDQALRLFGSEMVAINERDSSAYLDLNEIAVQSSSELRLEDGKFEKNN